MSDEDLDVFVEYAARENFPTIKTESQEMRDAVRLLLEHKDKGILRLYDYYSLGLEKGRLDKTGH